MLVCHDLLTVTNLVELMFLIILTDRVSITAEAGFLDRPASLYPSLRNRSVIRAKCLVVMPIKEIVLDHIERQKTKLRIARYLYLLSNNYWIKRTSHEGRSCNDVQSLRNQEASRLDQRRFLVSRPLNFG